MRKILYISGTRADYGLMRRTLNSIRRHPALSIEILVTGMHLMPQFGRTIDDIEKDKFKIHTLVATYKDDNRESILNFIGRFTIKLSEKLKQIEPDVILVLGDRAEMLAAAIAGTYLAIPIVHIHGGDTSSTVDEIVRHAITKLSHVHLTATKKSAKRIIKMGEEPWRVRIVGAPGVESISQERLLAGKEIARRYRLDLSRPVLLVIQHPVTLELKNASMQIKETLEAIKLLKYQTIVIYPNADAGGRKIINVIKEYTKYPFIQVYKNLLHKEYLSLMKIASVLVGNSSSGIIEASSFKLPVVNIGTRQKGRERTKNIIDVDYDRGDIYKAVRKGIFDTGFKEKVKKCKNPYYNGKTSQKIVKELVNLRINRRLLEKRLVN